MKRKDFLTKSSLTILAISAFGSIRSSGDKFKGDCSTTNDILGPFYRPNAPLVEDLTNANTSGTIITLKGSVFGSDCVTPITNAMVEIWHCDTEGEYDNSSDKFIYRARWMTNEMGEYSFKTILPGKYLNGKLFRPAHIHYRVTAENSKELISQIYFKGDPHIEEDPWASQDKAELRVLPIALEDTKGNLAVNFDVFLDEA